MHDSNLHVGVGVSGEFAHGPTRPLIHRHPTLHGFTLVELLVVVAIIVVLLALLVPAMDKAIYQAELAVCAANKSAVARGAIVYAADYKRYYPHRQGVRDDTVWSPSLIYNGNPALMAWGVAFGDGVSNTTVYDDRNILRGFISLKSLNDPLTGELDYDDVDSDSSAFATCNLFFGFGFKGFKAMSKLGDKMSYTYNNDPQYRWRFDVLASDRDCLAASGAQVSHPDASGLMVSTLKQNEDAFGTGMKAVFSAWTSEQGIGRGPVDLNFAMQDGSILRMTQVGWWEEDTAFVPDVTQGTSQLGVWWNTMPIQR